MQEAVTQRDSRCKTCNFKPAKAKTEVKVLLRLGKYFTHGFFLSEESEPLTCKEAVGSSISANLIEAMEEGMQSLNENETWSLVKSPRIEILFTEIGIQNQTERTWSS